MTLLEVAKVIKPHGLTGEVSVQLVTNRLERVAVGSVLSVTPDPSGKLPLVDGKSISSLRIISSRPHQGRYLVCFEGVVGRNAAEAIRNVVLRAEPMTDVDAFFVHELIGKKVVEVSGTERGTVTGIEANPASDLLILDAKYYVPLRFVVTSGEHIVIDPPEGLFE